MLRQAAKHVNQQWALFALQQKRRNFFFIILILIHFVSLVKDCLYYMTNESFSREGLMRVHPEHAKDISAQMCGGKTNTTITSEEPMYILGLWWSKDSLRYRLTSLVPPVSKQRWKKSLIKRLKGHFTSLLLYFSTSVSSTEMLFCAFFTDTPQWLPIMTH